MFFLVVGFHSAAVYADAAPDQYSIPHASDNLLANSFVRFDLKVVKAANDSSAQWHFKIESDNLDTAVELPLDSDIEYNGPPVVGAWRTFKIDILTIIRQGTGIDLDAIEKILVYPSWGKSEGAVYRLDNVQIIVGNNREVIFDDAFNMAWPSWDCCGGTVPKVVDDEDVEHDKSLEFRALNPSGTVLGFNRDSVVYGPPFQLSSMTSESSLLFKEQFIEVKALPHKPIHFNHILTEEVISLGTIYDLLKDDLGFLWFGGSDGLARYDGYELKTFTHDSSDPKSLSNNSVWDMLIDQQGRLWVATENGLNVFDHAKQNFTRYLHDANVPQSISNSTTKVLYEDSKGNIWIGTYGGGLNRYNADTNTFTHFNHDPANLASLSSDEINAISEDHKGTIWVGTDKGMNGYDPVSNTFTRFFKSWGNQNSLTDNTIRTIKEDSQQRLWVGTYNGLNLFDTTTGQVTRFRFKNTPTFDVVELEFDDDNRIFISTGEALFIFDPEKMVYSKHENDQLVKSSFEGKFPASMFNDGENWWFGTFPVGINYIDRNKNLFSTHVSSLNKPNALSHSSVLSITEDNHGNLWLGTDGGGLNYFDRQTGQFRVFQKEGESTEGLGGNAVLSTNFDTQGNLWISSWHAPLSIFSPATGEFVHKTSSRDGLPIPNNLFVWEMETDSHGDIWLATLGNGLVHFNHQTQTFTSYLSDEDDLTTIASNIVWSIFEDSDKQLWFGTSNGLEKFNRASQTFEHFQSSQSNTNSLSNNIVLDINEGEDGLLWLGTRGGGLNSFNKTTNVFNAFKSQDGLPDDVVTGIIAANKQSLWISTFNGLCNFDIYSQTCRNYQDIGGLQTNKFNLGSALQLASGEMAFGGIGGFTIFNPSDNQKNNTIPPVVFTDLQLANRAAVVGEEGSPLVEDISLVDEIILNHEQSMFSFEFSALDYQSPEGNQYAYFLKGYDSQWNEIGNRRRATYTNLDPGSYQFMVKGSNNEGIWNETPTSVNIKVLPPPWRSWWAYAIYAAVVLAVLGLIAYLQHKKLQERHQLKLALWASGDELWDIDLTKKQVQRQNKLEYLDRQLPLSWMFSDIQNSHIHPDDQARVRQVLNDHLKNKNGYYEISYRAKSIDGEWVWLLDRGKVTVRNITGAPQRFIGTTKNIHQLKTAEAELIALNKELEQRVEERTLALQQSNEYLKNTQAQLVESEKMASLATVIIGVSHELNTPAGVAITAVSHLKHELETLNQFVESGRLSKDQFNKFKTNTQTSIDLIESSLSRSVGIIQSFKEISVDQEKYQLKTVKLKQLLEQTVAGSSGTLEHRAEQRISIDCDPSLRINNYSDILASAVNQILLNIEQHAFSANETIVISIHAKKIEQGVQIVIEDEGKGMTDEDVAKLFDPFFTTDRGQNIGLGMFVVYNQIHNLLGGTITCSSAIGKGTRFIITLPATY